MHLVIDARTIRPGATGVGHYVAGLLRGLDALIESAKVPGLHVTALRLARAHSGSESWRRFWISVPNIEWEEVETDYESHPRGDLWLQRRLPALVRDLGGELLLSPAFIGPWGPSALPRIVIVHDTIAWEMRWAMPKGFRLYLRTAARLSAWGAARTMSVSPPTARRLTRLGFGSRRGVGVIPNAVDHSLFAPADQPERLLPDGRIKNRPLVLYTASFEPRKNHAVLFEAIRRLRHAKPEIVLLHSGSAEDQTRISRLTRGFDVSMVAPSCHADVAAWTRAADLAVYPSLMEGFGVPALEAMACGVPLIASNIDVMRWLTRGGECAELVNPRDALAWGRAIERALLHPELARAKRGHALARAQQFTWMRSAEILVHEAEVILRR